MKKIYVAEDQPAQAELMETILMAHGNYDLSFFNNGLELYLKVQEAPPDMLVLDVMLPTLNGLAIARLLKFHEDFRDIPMLVVSSITDAEIETRALKAGADAFLPKPFEVSAILDHVARLLGQSKGA